MRVHNQHMQPVSTSVPARTAPVHQPSGPVAAESQQVAKPIPPMGRPTSLKLVRHSHPGKPAADQSASSRALKQGEASIRTVYRSVKGLLLEMHRLSKESTLSLR